MGLSYSLFLSSSIENLKIRLFGLTEKPKKVVVRSISFDSNHGEMTLRTVSFKKRGSDNNEVVIEEPVSLKKQKPKRLMIETTVSFRDNLIPDGYKYNFDLKEKGDAMENKSHPTRNLLEPVTFSSPRPLGELDAAAIKVQKVYKSYRTRRNLADCAVVVEELWWKALDFAALKRSSVSFFDIKKPETAVSRWARARTRAAKVGKGLSKDEKAQKLALRHWLEAIDPRHRYGHNLHLYYDIWFGSESLQPFFYWLDVGDGKELNLENCSRTVLQRQCIKYLGPKEREAYEVIVDSGKLVYRHTRLPVDTVEGSKWIFVLSTSRNLYVGQKKKGLFQHSSFLAGGATTAAGRLVAHGGVLEAVWPYSGHYHPTEENFLEFISFLGEHHVSLTNVKRCAIDDDDPSIKLGNEEPNSGSIKAYPANIQSSKTESAADSNDLELSKRLSCQWTTGAGPRISCVRDYPAELQFQALEQVNLSPRLNPGHFSGGSAPIPSPRPSPKIRLSPRLAYMGLPSPRLHVSSAN